MVAAYVRLLTTFCLLLIIIGKSWTSLFQSARYTHGLMDRSVYNRLHPANKSIRRLLEAGSDGMFYLNGKPKRIISGEFHYFRIHPAQWEDRLRRMRTAGLNMIATRVPWNFHQRQKSTVPQFDGMWNLSDFIRIVHRLGFLLIVHVGPYIGADWELGGLPSWLLRYRHITLRTSNYPHFLKYVSRYFAHLLPIIERSTYRRHGPIIAVQIENEFGNYGQEDTHYMTELVQLVRSHGIQELILTADRGPHLRQGSVPGALSTVTCHGSVDDVTVALSDLISFQPHLPWLVTLLADSGASRWGKVAAHNTSTSVDNFRRSVEIALSWNASINIYVFSSGTNFELWNGAVEDAGADGS